MKAKIISMSGHRIDVMMAEWVKRALSLVSVEIVTKYYDVLIVTNGVLNSKIVQEMQDAPLAIYMWDDYDLPVPEKVKVLSQAKDLWGRFTEDTTYFPISQLACMSDLWLNPYVSDKKFNLVYGGTYKKVREEEYNSHIINNSDTLLIGSDIRWNKWDKTTRIPTVKNMDILYNILSMCRYTLILSDPKHDNNSIPLRFYESKFSNLSVIPTSEGILDGVSKVLDRKKVAQNLKDVIWKLM